MANTYYDSQLTAAEIEAALEAISGLIVPANNGKVLAINNGKFEARSVQWGGGAPVIEALSVTANGTYTAPTGVDGYSPVTVNVSGGGGSSFVTPDYQGLAWSYIATNGGYYSEDFAKQYYSSYFHVLANKTYCLFIGSVTSDRIRCHFYANKNISDFEEYIDNPMPNTQVYTCTNNISGGSDLTQYDIRFLFTPSSDGEIVFVTSRSSVSANAYCVEMPN